LGPVGRVEFGHLYRARLAHHFISIRLFHGKSEYDNDHL
jgi:hypothetical protein